MANAVTIFCGSGLGNDTNVYAAFTETATDPVKRTSTISCQISLKRNDNASGRATYDHSNGTITFGPTGNTKTFNGKNVDFNLGANGQTVIGSKTFVVQHDNSDNSGQPSINVSVAANYPTGGTPKSTTAKMSLTRLPTTPQTPTNLTASVAAAYGANGTLVWGITLHWNNGAGTPATSFKILRQPHGSADNFKQIASVTSGSNQLTSYQDLTLPDGSVFGAYDYAIEATNSGGTSDRSVKAVAYLPAAPPTEIGPIIQTNNQLQAQFTTADDSVPNYDPSTITYNVLRQRYNPHTDANGTYYQFDNDATLASGQEYPAGAIEHVVDSSAASGYIYRYEIQVEPPAAAPGDTPVTQAVSQVFTIGAPPTPPTVSLQQSASTTVEAGPNSATVISQPGQFVLSYVYDSFPITMIAQSPEPIAYDVQYQLNGSGEWTDLITGITPDTGNVINFDLTTIVSPGDSLQLRFRGQTTSVRVGTVYSDWTLTPVLNVFAPPAISLVTPTEEEQVGTSAPQIEWTFTPGSNNGTQTRAQFQFVPDELGAPVTTLTSNGPQLNYTPPPGTLETGSSYTLNVTATESDGLVSNVANVHFSVTYQPPGPPTADVFFDPVVGATTITCYPDPDQTGIYGEPAYFNVYRQGTDGSWTRIITNAASGVAVLDGAVPVSGDTSYQIEAVTADNLTASSPIYTITASDSEWFWFSYYDDQGFFHVLRAHGDLALTQTPQITGQTFAVAGRKLPVASYSSNLTNTVTIGATLDFATTIGANGELCPPGTLSDSPEAFNAMAEISPIVLFRGVDLDGSPVKLWGLLTSLQTQGNYGSTVQGVAMATLSITMSQIDFDESVTPV